MRGGPGDSRFELKLSLHSSDTVAPEGVAGFKRSAHSAGPAFVIASFARYDASSKIKLWLAEPPRIPPGGLSSADYAAKNGCEMYQDP